MLLITTSNFEFEFAISLVFRISTYKKEIRGHFHVMEASYPFLIQRSTLQKIKKLTSVPCC